jgi:hypothetical protein
MKMSGLLVWVGAVTQQRTRDFLNGGYDKPFGYVHNQFVAEGSCSLALSPLMASLENVRNRSAWRALGGHGK